MDENEHEQNESRLLEQGVTALTDDHLYFAFGDIADVYVARAMPPGAEHPFALVKIDPLADADEVELAQRAAAFVVGADGRFHALGTTGEVLESSFSVKALQPFGERQLAWYAELRDNRSDTGGSVF
jgi:hypothetical protein